MLSAILSSPTSDLQLPVITYALSKDNYHSWCEPKVPIKINDAKYLLALYTSRAFIYQLFIAMGIDRRPSNMAPMKPETEVNIIRLIDQADSVSILQKHAEVSELLYLIEGRDLGKMSNATIVKVRLTTAKSKGSFITITPIPKGGASPREGMEALCDICNNLFENSLAVTPCSATSYNTMTVEMDIWYTINEDVMCVPYILSYQTAEKSIKKEIFLS